MARTAKGHAAAKKALVRLGVQLGADAPRLIIIGGLGVEHLTRPTTPAHHGTTDIDAFVQLSAVYDRDEESFEWLEAALQRTGFAARGGGSRWYATVDDVEVRLDLLSDVTDNRGQEIALPGTRLLSSQNLEGPGAAAVNTVMRTIELDPHETPGATSVTLRFVGLGGYVLAKASAVLGRDEPKDLYDLAFVLLYNTDGGPTAAGRATARVLRTDPGGSGRRTVRSALARFDGSESDGAQTFSAQRQLDGDPTEPSVLAHDAVAAVRLFRRAFDAEVG